MVFKPINLARQSFVKTFTHGYAQSLVAASQSSSASQNTSFHTLGNNVVSLFNKTQSPPGSVHHNAGTQAPQAGPGSSAKATQSTDPASHEGGLAAYYAAWQHHRNAEEKELHQFQFAKRIGWKPPTTIPDSFLKGKDQGSAAEEKEKPQHRSTLSRSYTTSAVDEIKDAVKEVKDEAASGAVAEGAIDDVQDLRLVESPTSPVQTSFARDDSQAGSSTVVDSITSVSSEKQSVSPSVLTRPSSVSAVDSYTEHLSSLAERQQYAEIPAVFEAMLRESFVPSSSAYNALLLAAINIPMGKHQVASKALDVYADMLKRRVLPDTSTYAILIELLAARALDVTAMQKDLAAKRRRYGGVHQSDTFLLQSDEAESQILAEDDALSNAIRLFDTSAAVATKYVLPPETYRLLITACAESGRMSDSLRVWADLESRGIVPPTAVFAPMIQAFANVGDLNSAVECYNVYRNLAISHDKGEHSIVRKDEEVYAALIKAFASRDRMDHVSKFLTQIEEQIEADKLPAMLDSIAVQGLLPHELEQNRHADVIIEAIEKLSPDACHKALSMICVDAADKDNTPIALEAFGSLLGQPAKLSKADPAMAILAMHVRQSDVEAAINAWETLKAERASVDFIEPATMLANAMATDGAAETGLQEARQMFARISELHGTRKASSDVKDRIDEAVESIAAHLFKILPVPSAGASMQLLNTMVENKVLLAPFVERILAGLGPEHTSSMSPKDLGALLKIQGGLLANSPVYDVAHGQRFVHLTELVGSRGISVDSQTSTLVQSVLAKINRPDVLFRWQNPQATPVLTQSSAPSFSPVSSFSPISSSYEDSYDPYGSSTDFKGSTAITETLEKTHGRHANHLSEALMRFRNMRRTGRHPRYVTYSKLITAAAKENQIDTAEDILAMAKQDVPMISHSKVVRQGWATILDSMVGACLNVGRRDMAARYHNDLLSMGSTPSANTFGLYITTLKESTKTFDEATEAVKIFHQAKNEGVEPSSFLYNALIGKLGKARRIDDCLFYFAEMRNLGIRPTSVTYGTIVNALCRVSDDYAEELFEEMESASNYKPRPAPYNCLMQYFLSTKRDRSKVLAYYERMKRSNIQPTMHTYKLLIDTYATLDPIDLDAATAVIEDLKRSGLQPEAVHYASLIHAKGCVLHDMTGARALFDSVISSHSVSPNPSLYQALFESYVANHDVAATEPLLAQMNKQRVKLTPYIANTLIHGWANASDVSKAREIFERLGRDGREPSTYEAMNIDYLSVG